MSPRKVTDYLLAAAHPKGGAKARFFRAFGFEGGRSELLITALFDHPIRNAVADVVEGPFGAKYIVRCALETPDGRNPCVVSVWIVEADRRPRLVTAYPA